MTDSELLAAFVGGSEEAFRTLVERYIHVVYGTARRQVGEPAAAEDVTQAVFMVLARRAKGIRDGRTLPAWLLRVTKFCAIDARRSAARRRHHEQGAAAMKAMLTPEQDAEVSRHVLAQLDVALEELGAIDRTAIVLRYLRDQPMAEIGAALGISEEAAKKRVARAMEKLRKVFARHGVALSPGILGAKIAEQAITAPPGLVAHVCAGALAKGASISAASIIAKGVVKLMAWTTTKLVAASALAVVVLAVAVIGVIKVALEKPHDEPVVAVPSVVTTTAPTIGGLPPIVPYNPVAVEVRDMASGQPLENVHIDITADNATNVLASAITGANGVIPLSAISAAGNSFAIKASKEGLVPVQIYWTRYFPSDQPPQSFLIKMERAVTIGGRVLDQDDKPLEGASVWIAIGKQYPNGGIPTLQATTDARGVWSLNAAPEQCDRVLLAASHPMSLSEDGAAGFSLIPLQQLRDKSGVIHLSRGVPVHGIVRGPDGLPRKAWVGVGDERFANGANPEIATDDFGRFELGVVRDGQNEVPPEMVPPPLLVVRAEGCATQAVTFKLGQTNPVLVNLKPASPLAARFIDMEGHPIANARITADHWFTQRDGMEFQTPGIAATFISDADGRIRWNEAIDKDIGVTIDAAGYLKRTNIRLRPGAPNEITLWRLSTIKGRVLDAQTGQPVQNFHVLEALHNDPPASDAWMDYPVYWQQNFRVPASGGKYGDGSFEFCDEEDDNAIRLRAQAEDYTPVDSGVLVRDGTQSEVVFRLTKGERFASQLLDIDDKPAANIKIRLGLAWINVQDAALPVSEKAQASDPSHFVTTDAQGRFSFPPQAGNFMLLAATEKGYLIAKSQSLDHPTSLQLTPWAAVSGTLLIDGRPAPGGQHVGAVFDPPDLQDSIGPDCHFTAITDNRGHFSFPKMFAGPYRIVSDLTEISPSIPPGETTTITLGKKSPADSPPPQTNSLP